MDQLSEKADILDSRVVNALNACALMLQKKFPGAGTELILFGSQAIGNADPESDVDLLVLVDEKTSPETQKAIHDAIYEVSLDFDVVISAIITTRRQWESPVTKLLPLYRNIVREGIRVA